MYVPIPKFLGWDSNKGFLTALATLPAAAGAGAGFFPVPLALAGWSLRRVHQQQEYSTSDCPIALPRSSSARFAQSTGESA